MYRIVITVRMKQLDYDLFNVAFGCYIFIKFSNEQNTNTNYRLDLQYIVVFKHKSSNYFINRNIALYNFVEKEDVLIYDVLQAII